jgi:hypothetical protein
MEDKTIMNMDNKRALWNSQQNLLKSILLKPDRFDEAIRICLEQHVMVHSSEMSQFKVETFEDELWEGLTEPAFRAMPTAKDETIAWSIWHLTRIEDITMNILVADDPQVINTGNWLEKMNIKVCDTGNAMTDEEIIDLSANINMQELRNYRIAVGRKTREIIQKSQPADLKRKMTPERLQRILDEGAVLNVDGAKWLIDFWGRKNVAGIFLMPITRHHMVHINESLRLKKVLLKKS